MNPLDRVGEWIFYKLGLGSEEFIEIRDDFLSLFETALGIPDIEKRMAFSISELQKGATKCYYSAPDYDPHESVFSIWDTFQILQFFLKLLRFLFPLLLVGALVSGFSLGGMPWAVGLFAPFAILTLLFEVYIYHLKADTWFYQQMNDELRISPKEINNTRRRTKLVSYYVWNCAALHDPKMMPTLGFMYIIQLLSDGFYNRIMGNLETYIEDLYEKSQSDKSVFSIYWGMLRGGRF